MSLFPRQIWRNVALHHLQWMGAVRMRVQTADKNITKIHTTPVHQLTSCEAKSCLFVRNKFIIKLFLTSNCCFWLKYESSIHNIAFSSEKVVLSESGEKYAQIKHHLQAKTNMSVDFDMRGQQEMDLFTGGSVIMDYGLTFWLEVIV